MARRKKQITFEGMELDLQVAQVRWAEKRLCVLALKADKALVQAELNKERAALEALADAIALELVAEGGSS